MFQVYRQPLPAAHLHLEDLPDGDPSSSGSFRGAFTGNDKGKGIASHTSYCFLFLKRNFLILLFKKNILKILTFTPSEW